jgi:hypothetical protein
MKRFLRLKKLNQAGFDHILTAVAFIMIIGVGGTYYLLSSHANPWSGAFELGSTNSGFCMDEVGAVKSGAYLDLNKCNNKIDQKWQLLSTTYKSKQAYQIQNYTASANVCVDDWQDSKATGSANLLRLYDCNSADPAQLFYWTGTGNHQLENYGSSLCIDALNGSTAANTHLDLYTCKKTSLTNQEWFEVSNAASATGGGSGTGGSKTTSSSGAGLGKRTTSTGSGSSSDTASGDSSDTSSGSDGGDLTKLLTALQASDPNFDCSTLQSASDLQQCNNVFGQGQ